MADRPFAGLFVSHGAPTLPLEAHPARDFLRDLGRRLPRPRAIVVVSPHWTAATLSVKAPPQFETWHDFRGFPPELYRIEYRPRGDAALRDSVVARLEEARIDVAVAADDRRLDHGAWVPLLLMYPEADVPLVQVSLPAGPRACLDLGRALRPLAADDVLLLGTGGAVHNLGEVDFGAYGAPPAWAREFDDWLATRVVSGAWAELCDYRRLAPHAARAHPDEDHLLPLFFAGGGGERAAPLHRSFGHGSLSLAAYGFA